VVKTSNRFRLITSIRGAIQLRAATRSLKILARDANGNATHGTLRDRSLDPERIDGSIKSRLGGQCGLLQPDCA
jgi:hypothetical protein